MDAIECILTRRSIRKFLDKEVEQEKKENEIGNLVSDDELQEEKPVDDPLVSDSDEEIQTPLCSKYISVLRSSFHSFRFVKEEQKEECM